MMRASQQHDQRRRRERRRQARIALLKEAEAGLSPTSLFNIATARPPQPEEERRDRRVPPPAFGPIWCAGDKVHWHGYIGFFLQDDDDGYAQVLIGTRSYRARKAELRSA